MKRLPAVVLAAFLSVLACAAVAGAAPKSHTGLAGKKVAALIQLQHPGGLNKFVRRVSDPSDPHYRHYSTVEALVARFGAKPKVQARVAQWLAARGVHATLSPTHMFFSADLPAGQAKQLLPAAPAALLGDGNGVPRMVPTALRGAVTAVTVSPEARLEPHDAIGPAPGVEAEAGEHGKGPYGSLLFHSGTSKGCAAGSSGGPKPLEPFTPNQYLTAYGDTAMHERGLLGEGQSVAVVEQGGFRPRDIATYAKCFGVTPPPISAQALESNKPAEAEDETTLDLEQLSVGAPGLDHIYVYEAPKSLENSPNAIDAIVGAAGAALGDSRHRPDVISISLGICEPQLAWRNALDNIFAVAAGSGISVLVSSGDQGSTGCRAENTETEATTALPLLAVSLPSSSPYATAVGGTNLSLTKDNRIHDEIVWNDSFIGGHPGIPWGGGGGASIISPRTPWWQTGVKSYGPGRKVPDLAALADRFPGYSFYCSAPACKGEEEAVPGWSAVGGTSAATPLTAAGIALVNQAAEERGEPPLGFLNPLIYQAGASAKTRAAAFNDVTRGDDNVFPALDKLVVGQSIPRCCQARPGYDWASGWGSLKIPGFEKLATAAYKATPAPRPAPED